MTNTAHKSAPTTSAFAVEVTDDTALALAQFVKRIGWQEVRACAVDETEAYEMLAGIESIRRALATIGYSPR